MEPVATSVKGAAKALNVGRTTIYLLLKSGKLQKVKLGRRTLIKVDSIRALVDGGGARGTE